MDIGLSRGKSEDNEVDNDIRKVIQEELALMIPTIVNEIYKAMPPEIIDYRNKIQSAKLHNQEPTRDFNKEIQGHKNRMEAHEQKYPDTPTMDRISNKGISLAEQMGDRQFQIERIQRRQRRL